jgi:hypothetical protein
MARAAPAPYRKPSAICRVSPELEALASPDAVAAFVAAEKRRLEAQVAALGLRLRLATLADIDAIQQLQASRFASGTLVEDAYVLFRIVRFGFAPLVETPGGLIVACAISQGHDDPDRTTWGIRNSVDPSVSGSNLAAVLATYSCLLGMERGSRLRRAFVSPGNHASLANVLNHVGFIAETFAPTVPGHVGPRFILAMPLTPGGVRNNGIDHDKVRTFMAEHKEGRDYVVVPCGNLDELAALYRETPFRVVAFLRAAEDAFLALPRERLGIGP